MATLHCVRHGETDANLAGRWQGHDNQTLNATGRRQARAAVGALRRLPIDEIVSSDLARARDTAAPLARALGLPVQVRAELREIDVGSWAGLDRAQVVARYPDAARRHADGGTGWTDGETYDELAVRVVAAVNDLLAARPADVRVALFCHGGVVRALAAAAVGLSVRDARLSLGTPVHLGLTTLTLREGRWRLECYNVPLVEPPEQAAPPDERRERDDAAPGMEPA